MLERKIYKKLMSWKKKQNKNALLVTGARQIGKTYSIRQFGKEQYEHVAEVNFISMPRSAEIFSSSRDADSVILGLTALLGKALVPGKTLIFFDEIQECPDARTAIKFLVEDGRFDYIESGSLLGVAHKEVPSYPVGYEDTLHMYPMDFEEFAKATGVQPSIFDTLRTCYEEGIPVNTAVHTAMLEIFRHYIIVGGMPAVVQSYIDNKDIGRVIEIQQNILALYRQDISKYADRDKIKIRDIFDSIPAQLDDKNRRFVLASMAKTARMERFENSFLWLNDAGVGLPCYNVAAPITPLKLNEQRNLFKLFLCDTGLLCAASLENVQFEILSGNLSVNLGSILENQFAQEFTAHGFPLWYINKPKYGEVDFLVQQGAQVIPIEIKSGKDFKKHVALDNYLKVGEFNIKNAYVFCMGNIEKSDKITYLPWYMAPFFQCEVSQQQFTSLNMSALSAVLKK